jgi:hypothetical protein
LKGFLYLKLCNTDDYHYSLFQVKWLHSILWFDLKGKFWFTKIYQKRVLFQKHCSWVLKLCQIQQILLFKFKQSQSRSGCFAWICLLNFLFSPNFLPHDSHWKFRCFKWTSWKKKSNFKNENTENVEIMKIWKHYINIVIHNMLF